MENINRLKIVLVEKKRIGKWLAEQLGEALHEQRVKSLSYVG